MSVRKGQGRTRDYESPNHRQDSRRDYGEEDFLKDKRSPSMFDMLYMYFFSTPARKLAVGILMILMVRICDLGGCACTISDGRYTDL
jgi:hypothetical protein